MKLISFAIPCYNSAAFMHKCIESILSAFSPNSDISGQIEIILVNDGSKDGTGKVCDEWAQKYPDVIKAVHQENKGHGGAVNTGLEHASGFYFKVVDSDDWVDASALRLLLARLNIAVSANEEIDLFVANYVYENSKVKSKKVIRYKNIFPENEIVTWAETHSFKPSQYLLMHSLFYRTEMIQKGGFKLPEHTFYVDNVFAYVNLPFVKKICYLNIDFYRYFIGRDDQSVNENIMVERADQQVAVTRIMIDAYNLTELKKTEKRLARYMSNYLSMMIGISSLLLFIRGDEASLAKWEELWEYLHQKDRKLYRKMKYRAVSSFTANPNYVGRKLAIGIYRTAQKIYKFN